jgi:hypothetical protein
MQGLTSLSLLGPRVFTTPKAFVGSLRRMKRLQRLELGDPSFKCDQERR